ncbi:PDC sensor domain-containing protein [Streptosporangiaceae bacterium NEAU-GS5]|nr:PDC sensor domain-containing protein [Streptosporangiaceae bacterium NEAU-GS5]
MRVAPRVREVLGDVVGELEQVFADLDTLGGRFADIATAGEPPQRESLAALRPTIFGVLAAHRGLVAGAGVITAPGLLRDAPRWLEWWWTKAAGTPEALRVNLDPAAPDFFDYTTADWYLTPERTLARQVTGPFVDYACTNEYTITLSVPVRAGERLLGMAAADVLAASVEQRVLGTLAAFDHPVILASADGRVIASNSPRWTPGLRIPPPSEPAEQAPLVSWTLVDAETL